MQWLTRLTGRRPAASAPTAPSRAPSSAAEEAALAQRITGPGRGPYSGTPFLPAQGAIDADGNLLADHVPDEAEQHHRGIIDPVRHVSSLGRR